ncbi:NADH-dependent flavin oxidoreductase-like protein [Phyllosticta citriasiana]|uniref:NADH-dependent flavin oxidoreductase-like protein n=1 Tax=Phyllosticta citriasiana TaxID=595635 RepID=A0ABR1KNS3_9PEZI
MEPFAALKKVVPGQDGGKPGLENKAAEGIPYFTPAQNPPSGTAWVPQSSGKPIPKLFQPLKLRGLTLQNRIGLAPLCQYSAQDGHMTDWHVAHLGGIISRGPGLSFVEATGVTPEGRITPEDVGLWKDSQIEPIKRVVDFAHSQNQLIGIQLAHAGRKASTVAPWLSPGDIAGEELNGWPKSVYAPSAIPYNERHASPHAYTKEQLQDLKKAWADATRRALKCGFDTIQIHNAHGYLLHEFLSPVTNKRTDEYGGSFENRVRLSLEIVEIVRSIIPETMPLTIRVSATDWLEEDPEFGREKSWTVDDTARFAEILAEKGVDLIDISSAGNHPNQKIKGGPAYQAAFAKTVKAKVGEKILVASVGSISTGKLAQQQLDDGLDMVFAGRWFQKNPGLVWAWAEELGVEINVANQIRWGFGGRGKSTKSKF